MKTNPIRNCPVRFKTPCPRKWESLQPTADSTVRHCDVCHKKVHLCTTDASIMEHARQGDCVAWFSPPTDNLPAYGVLGQPTVPSPPPTAEQMAALKTVHLDAAKTEELNKLKYSSRFCPECGFPCPNWYEACRVCGYSVGRVKSSR